MYVNADPSASIFTRNHKEVPVADKGWKEGEPYVVSRCLGSAYTYRLLPRVPYAALVSTFEKIEATTKRLEILNLLTQFLLVVAKRDTATSVKDSNLLKVVYLCINRVRLAASQMEHRTLIAAVPRLHGHRAWYRGDAFGQGDRRKHGQGYYEDQGRLATGRRSRQSRHGE